MGCLVSHTFNVPKATANKLEKSARYKSQRTKEASLGKALSWVKSKVIAPDRIPMRNVLLAGALAVFLNRVLRLMLARKRVSIA